MMAKIKAAVLLLLLDIVPLTVDCIHWPVFPSLEKKDNVDYYTKRHNTKCSWCTYETKSFDQNVDHFNFVSNKTFKHRYLVNKAQWKPGGPIFLYCGNEGAIEYFAKTVGLMWEMSPDFNAMVVFAEQRYQGNSLPFGKKSLSAPRYTGYLSSSQVLADYAQLVNFIKENTTGARNSPVIAFGGSLGGQYAAWMRMKYPNVIAGSLASSAPIFQFSVPCGTQYSLVTRAFEKHGGRACVDVIRKSWLELHKLGIKKRGRKFISKTFRLCEPIKTYMDLYKLRDKLAMSYLFLSMENYPYVTASKPAWPIKAVCHNINSSKGSSKKLIQDLAQGLFVYYNHSRTLKCVHLPRNGKEFLGAWNYQSCSEMPYPLCSDNVHDMYYRSGWSLEGLAAVCQKTWGISPDPRRVPLQYGDRDIVDHSSIVFSNGDIDPWAGGGVLSNLSESLVAINIKEGAHTYDLRFTHAHDSQSVLEARKKEKYYVGQFIEKWKKKMKTIKLS